MAPPWLKMKRRYLDDLRKFIFVMYYHQLSIGYTYFQPDHPGNLKSRRWIEAYRKRNGLLDSPQHVWLHVLRYYLNTPHHEIIALGRKVEEKIVVACAPTDMDISGPGGIQAWQERCNAMEVDPELDDWKCLGYYTQMQMFLAIWEAAPGEEFVMSDSSFGLYEGRSDSAGPLHKFFVVSPKIVLVLCHPGLKEHDTSPDFINLMNPYALRPDELGNSMLLNAPHKAAKVKYARSTPIPRGTTVMYGNPGALSQSPEDDFEFEISPLSPTETHTVNAIILGNLNANGNLTFRSPDAALRTLVQFTINEEFANNRRVKLLPLTRLLSPTGSSKTVRARYIASLAAPSGSLWASSYEIYQLLQQGTDADCERFRRWVQIYSLCWPVDLFPRSQCRPARLVKTMDDHTARMTFCVCEKLASKLTHDLRDETVYGNQILMAFLDHMLLRHRRMFESLEEQMFGPIEFRGGSAIMEYTDVQFLFPSLVCV